MPIRVSTLISFVLIVASIFSWGVLLKQSYDAYALWSHGKTATVLPINNYQQTDAAHSDPGAQGSQTAYYVADLRARLESGEVVILPRKPVTLSQISASHQTQMKIVFLPNRPEVSHFAGEEPRLLRTLAFACVASVAAFLWFRLRRS
jgi:hypothetical protein